MKNDNIIIKHEWIIKVIVIFYESLVKGYNDQVILFKSSRNKAKLL